MIKMIAAIGKNGELGKDNNLIWRIPEDLSFFREYTMNKWIVMGKNTFFSLPRRLPNRKYIILSTTLNKDELKMFSAEEIKKGKTIKIFSSLEEFWSFYKKNSNEEFVVIGGAKIYSQFLPLSDELCLTEINDSKPADAFFPKISSKEWKTADEDKTHQKDQISYVRKVYQRIKTNQYLKI